MELKFFCPRWGSEKLDWETFCKKVRAAGYDGVEAGVPFEEKEFDDMRTNLLQNDLQLIGQYWQSFEKDFEQHKLSFKKHLHRIAELKPIKIDSQTGKDYFSFGQNKELFNMADEFTSKTGIPVAHETHRNKALFAAHITKNFLDKIPQLRITADFSHWCNVAESFLEDQQEAIEAAIPRTIHIHARVGHPESPQVTDPRLPEWQIALNHHMEWWQKIILYHRQSNTAILTITPEFGPPPYMPVEPVTLEPLAHQWEINVWMMKNIKDKR